MSKAARDRLRYLRRRMAERPDYQPRRTVTHSPKRWTDESLTERWEDYRARKLAERSCG